VTSSPRTIDLNCDLGEGAGSDADLMSLITSANIACGAHAGDAATMRAMMALAHDHGVSVGAHPGFSDREHFGRREFKLSPLEVTELVRSQVSALAAMGEVSHVKPHGALYSLATRDRTVADAVVAGIWAVDRRLKLWAMPKSQLFTAGKACGLTVASEAFIDRTYQADGTLTPRSCPNALLEDEKAAVAQALRIVCDGVVRTTDGTDITIVADTLCLHGDAPRAVAFARRLRQELTAVGIEVRAFGRC